MLVGGVIVGLAVKGGVYLDAVGLDGDEAGDQG